MCACVFLSPKAATILSLVECSLVRQLQLVFLVMLTVGINLSHRPWTGREVLGPVSIYVAALYYTVVFLVTLVKFFLLPLLFSQMQKQNVLTLTSEALHSMLEKALQQRAHAKEHVDQSDREKTEPLEQVSTENFPDA